MTEIIHRGPLTFQVAKWYGYMLAAMYSLYGAVRLILAVLDRNYNDLLNPMVFLMAGILLVIVALGFRDLRRWGWFGLVAVHGLVIVRTVFSLSQIDYLVLLVLSVLALVCLFAPPTRIHLFGGR